MKANTRGFYIRRKERIITEDAKGNKKETIKTREFPCRCNAAIPANHRMLVVER